MIWGCNKLVLLPVEKIAPPARKLNIVGVHVS